VRQNKERAARLQEASAALQESIGVPQPPKEQADVELAVAEARAALGETAFGDCRQLTWPSR
jgi:hypothetical protein